MNWTDVKRQLQNRDQRELLKLIKSLYDLNETNRTFIQASLPSGASHAIQSYKKIISLTVDPDAEDPIELKRARKAISDYAKSAPGDLSGQVDLMLHFVECGTRQTLRYGDIDGPFYDSLCSMIDRILKSAPKLSVADHAAVANRMSALDELARDQVGWGYSDHLESAAAELVQQTEDRK